MTKELFKGIRQVQLSGNTWTNATSNPSQKDGHLWFVHGNDPDSSVEKTEVWFGGRQYGSFTKGQMEEALAKIKANKIIAISGDTYISGTTIETENGTTLSVGINEETLKATIHNESLYGISSGSTEMKIKVVEDSDGKRLVNFDELSINAGTFDVTE